MLRSSRRRLGQTTKQFWPQRRVCQGSCQKSRVKLFRRRTAGQNASLLLQLRDFEPPSIADETAWEEFYTTIGGWLDLHYPQRVVTITSRDPAYITPEIKYMLRRRNKLMKRGLLEQASALSTKIGREIARFNSVELRRLDTATGTKELLAAGGKLTGAQEQPATEPTITAEELNIQFASTSTDVSYQPPIWRSTASPSLQIFNDRQIR